MTVFHIKSRLKIISLLISSFVSGQNRNMSMDSLKTLIIESYRKDLYDNHKDVLRYSTELYYLAKNQNNTEDVLFSLFEQSRIYFMENKFETTLKRIEEGVILSKKEENYNMLCRFLLIYQSLLVQFDYIQLSKQMIKKCQHYNTLVKNKDDKHINTIYILIAEAESYVNNEGLSDNMNKVIALKKQAYSESTKINSKNPLKKFTQIFSLESLSWSSALNRNFDEAQYYLEAADSLLTVNPNYYLNIDGLITKGAIENIKRNHQKAASYFNEAIHKSDRSGAIYKLYTMYPMISASYGEMGDYFSAMEYSWKAKDMIEELRELKIEGNNIVIINRINRELGKPDEAFNWYYIVIGSGSILFIGTFLVVRKNRFLKQSNIANKRNDIINVVEKQQDSITTTDFNNSDVNKNLVTLAKEDINTFYIEFEKYYPDFHFILKNQYPELNLSDINFCSLIKMKFDIKQIAIYTNTTLRSVESRRFRIRKKMELKGQDDLYLIIANIS